MNLSNREMMNLVRKVEITLDENDDLAKKILDNSRKVRKDLAVVKKQINLSKTKVAPPKHQVRNLKRLDISCRDPRLRINDHDVLVIRDSRADEERNPAPVNDIDEISGGAGDSRDKRMSNVNIREVMTTSDEDVTMQAGIIDDDIIDAGTGTSVDEIREMGSNDDDVTEAGTSNDGASGGDAIYPANEYNPVEGDSEDLANNNVSEFEEDYSRVSIDALRQVIKFATDTIENSDKSLESQKEELKKMERHSGQCRSPEWMERMEKKIAVVKKNMSVHKNIKKKMESKISSVKREFERRKLIAKKKVIVNEGRSISGASSSSFMSKRKLNESLESVIDLGMIRNISAKEEGVMVMKELVKEENPCEDTFECNFCSKVFTSAGPLTAHLQNHNGGNKRLDCPWPACSYVNTPQNLTKHMRSKHTKEELFRCVQCPKKFHSMDTKLNHEKKHWQQNEWDQCNNCLRFYKWVRGSCSFCPKKY